MALEIALKIKELTYIHAEAICSGELKHGVIALINSNPKVELEKTSFIVLAPDCSDIDKLLICIDEIKTRKAHITVITDNNTLFKDRKIDCLMEIPKMNFFSSLLCLYPIH